MQVVITSQSHSYATKSMPAAAEQRVALSTRPADGGGAHRGNERRLRSLRRAGTARRDRRAVAGTLRISEALALAETDLDPTARMITATTGLSLAA
jgi:hypothetical protein